MALTKIPASLLDTSGGFDLQGNITLGDSEKILLGASSDLQTLQLVKPLQMVLNFH